MFEAGLCKGLDLCRVEGNAGRDQICIKPGNACMTDKLAEVFTRGRLASGKMDLIGAKRRRLI